MAKPPTKSESRVVSVSTNDSSDTGSLADDALSRSESVEVPKEAIELSQNPQQLTLESAVDLEPLIEVDQIDARLQGLRELITKFPTLPGVYIMKNGIDK